MLDRQSGRAGTDDGVRFVINNFLDILCRHAEDMTDLIRQRVEIPDMHDGHGKRDMPEAFAAHGFRRYFYSAAVANNTFVPDTFIFTAKAFPIASRSEDLLAKESVFFRPVRT